MSELSSTDDLRIAFEALRANQADYSLLWDYYEGNQPLIYSAQRLQTVFKNLNARFVQNWCAVVVDSTMDRLNLSGFSVSGNEEATARLNRLFQSTELDLDSDDAHLAALVCGDSYIIVWRGEDEIEAVYNDPRLCYIRYSAENPRTAIWAAKWWIADDGCYRLTLYYPDHLDYYLTKKEADLVDSVSAFEPGDPPSAPNPFGIVPVFHLRRDRRAGGSELANVVPIQNAVNKLLNDMMISAEFGAFRQRWVISDADISQLKNAPNEIWSLPSGDGTGQPTSVGEFGQTSLSIYLDAIDRLSMSAAIITRTPKHYLFGQGGVPSGEALITMEAPLVRKCQRYIERLSSPWRKIAAFLLRLDGMEINEHEITPIFDPPETVQPRTEAEIREIGVRTGIPLETLLREEGKSAAWIEAMRADQKAAAEAQSRDLAAALMDAQRRFDQGPNAPEE